MMIPMIQVRLFNKDLRKYQDQLSLLNDKKKSRTECKTDINDERFKAIYEKSDFAIDPTHKNYKDQSSGLILQEQISRRKTNKK